MLPKGMRRRERRGRKEVEVNAVFSSAISPLVEIVLKGYTQYSMLRPLIHWIHSRSVLPLIIGDACIGVTTTDALSNCFETHTEQLVELLSSLPNKSRTRHNCAGFHALTQDLRRHPTGIIKSRRIQMIYYLSLFNNKRAFLNAIVTNKLNGHEEL